MTLHCKNKIGLIYSEAFQFARLSPMKDHSEVVPFFFFPFFIVQVSRMIIETETRTSREIIVVNAMKGFIYL